MVHLRKQIAFLLLRLYDAHPKQPAADQVERFDQIVFDLVERFHMAHLNRVCVKGHIRIHPAHADIPVVI